MFITISLILNYSENWSVFQYSRFPLFFYLFWRIIHLKTLSEYSFYCRLYAKETYMGDQEEIKNSALRHDTKLGTSVYKV